MNDRAILLVERWKGRGKRKSERKSFWVRVLSLHNPNSGPERSLLPVPGGYSVKDERGRE